MDRRKLVIGLFSALLGLMPLAGFAQSPDGLGQTIQINTRFHSFLGKPSWLLMLRDIDQGINIPYVYDITRGDNYWMAFSYSHNYVIVASTMQFSPYENLRINNFCHLESKGHILHGESFYITIQGDLTANPNTYTCHVMKFQDATN